MSDTHQALLQFFKALADANRLRIVGLLARREHTVEELAEVLGLRASTVSHHVAKLVKAGLVSGTPDGHHHAYALQVDALEELARRLLSTEQVADVAADVDLDAWDRKVLDAFLGPDGRLQAFPVQRKKFEAILRLVVRAFEADRTYTGREVDDALRRWSDDTATLRRGLIDHRMMARDPAGTTWWRLSGDGVIGSDGSDPGATSSPS
ncbi:MAG: metalloregulator ArsR/SmtB family transcription factor [Myxococcota bacterium]